MQTEQSKCADWWDKMCFILMKWFKYISWCFVYLHLFYSSMVPPLTGSNIMFSGKEFLRFLYSKMETEHCFQVLLLKGFFFLLLYIIVIYILYMSLFILEDFIVFTQIFLTLIQQQPTISPSFSILILFQHGKNC